MGYFIAFKVTQHQIKSSIVSEIKSGIITNATTVIIINKNELSKLEWLEKDKEMRYNNERYDVVKSEENTTSITYYCINDKQEETLFAELDTHINTHIINTKPSKNNAPKSLEHDVAKIFFANNQQKNFILTENKVSFFSIKKYFNSAFINTNSLPPELV